MPKVLCIVATAIAVLLLLVFAFDLATALLFGRPTVMDIGFIIATAILAYLGWDSIREQK
jgi:hypothetical protein